MSETTYPVRPEIAAHARISAAQYGEDVVRAAKDPNGFWADHKDRVAWMREPTRILDGDFTGDVRVTWFADGTLNASVSCLDRHLATRGDQTAIIWEGDDPSQSEHVSYRDLHARVCRLGNVLRDIGVGEGRPGLPVFADGHRGGGRDARLRADRGGPYGRVRRLLGRQPRATHPGCRLHGPDHRRRRPARRPQGAAEDQRRRGAGELPGSHPLHRRHHDRRRGADDRGPRSSLRGAGRRRRGHLRAGGDERRGSAVHPVYLRQHRQAERRAAHDRRLSGLGELHARDRLRLSGWRDLLVHGRCRLGDRAQLHRLRPARERGDHADVRGRAELSGCEPGLAGRRQASRSTSSTPHRPPSAA